MADANQITVTLSTGQVATLRRPTGRNVVKIQERAGDKASAMMSLAIAVAMLGTLDGQPIVPEDALALWADDLAAIEAALRPFCWFPRRRNRRPLRARVRILRADGDGRGGGGVLVRPGSQARRAARPRNEGRLAPGLRRRLAHSRKAGELALEVRAGALAVARPRVPCRAPDRSAQRMMNDEAVELARERAVLGRPRPDLIKILVARSAHPRVGELVARGARRKPSAFQANLPPNRTPTPASATISPWWSTGPSRSRTAASSRWRR